MKRVCNVPLYGGYVITTNIQTFASGFPTMDARPRDEAEGERYAWDCDLFCGMYVCMFVCMYVWQWRIGNASILSI